MNNMHRGVVIPLLFILGAGNSTPVAVAPPEEMMRDAEAAMKADSRPKQYQKIASQAAKCLQTDPAKAERLFKNAIALESLFVEVSYARIGLAQAYLSQNKYRQCAELCVTLYAESEGFGGSARPQMLANWATALLGLGNVRKAAQIANRAAAALQTSENRPDIPVFPETEAMPYTPSEVRAVVALVRGIQSSRENYTPEGYAATLAYFEDAARLAPRLGAAHFFVGKTREYKGHHAEARTAFEKAIRYSGNATVQRLANKALSDLPVVAPASP